MHKAKLRELPLDAVYLFKRNAVYFEMLCSNVVLYRVCFIGLI